MNMIRWNKNSADIAFEDCQKKDMTGKELIAYLEDALKSAGYKTNRHQVGPLGNDTAMMRLCYGFCPVRLKGAEHDSATYVVMGQKNSRQYLGEIKENGIPKTVARVADLLGLGNKSYHEDNCTTIKVAINPNISYCEISLQIEQSMHARGLPFDYKQTSAMGGRPTNPGLEKDIDLIERDLYKRMD